MMNEWVYLTLASAINTVVQFVWKKKMARVQVDRNALLLIFVGSFCAAWGIDVIQRGLEVLTFEHILKVSLGCWLMFAAATAAKHYKLSGRTLKEFRNDYTGDLIGFLLMGIIIHVLS